MKTQMEPGNALEKHVEEVTSQKNVWIPSENFSSARAI